MADVYFWDSKVLFDSGKVAMAEACCCADSCENCTSGTNVAYIDVTFPTLVDNWCTDCSPTWSGSTYRCLPTASCFYYKALTDGTCSLPKLYVKLIDPADSSDKIIVRLTFGVPESGFMQWKNSFSGPIDCESVLTNYSVAYDTENLPPCAITADPVILNGYR